MASFYQAARRVAYSSDKSDHTSTHHIKRLSRSAPFSLFVDALEQDGCVIVKDFTDKATLAKADQEVRPWLNQLGEGGAVVGGRFLGATKVFFRALTPTQPSKGKREQ